jgi:hypothetical protein
MRKHNFTSDLRLGGSAVYNGAVAGLTATEQGMLPAIGLQGSSPTLLCFCFFFVFIRLHRLLRAQTVLALSNSCPELE